MVPIAGRPSKRNLIVDGLSAVQRGALPLFEPLAARSPHDETEPQNRQPIPHAASLGALRVDHQPERRGRLTPVWATSTVESQYERLSIYSGGGNLRGLRPHAIHPVGPPRRRR